MENSKKFNSVEFSNSLSKAQKNFKKSTAHYENVLIIATSIYTRKPYKLKEVIMNS